MKPRIGTPLIDREEKIEFEFDGKTYRGFAGDSLASALLANDVKIFGRSFKYHRPRGLLSDGIEEPNALVTIGEGAFRSPNIRATEVEIFQGLKARSQNYLGSLHWDFLRFNDYISSFLGAGFYYKTFKWPKAAWEKLYEPAIRRAAGLGALSGEEDRQKYERGFLFCDLLIIGSGLAGLQSALIAGEAGADVILAEGDFEFGGRLIKDQGRLDGKTYREWRDDALNQLRQMPNVRLMSRSYVLGAYDGGIYGVLERVRDFGEASPDLPRQCFWRVHAKQAILAAGATERPIAFDNNDTPGIMLASAVRAYLNRHGVAAGENIAIFTNNDEGWKLASDLKALGITPKAIIDPRGNEKHDGSFEVFQGQVVDAHGGKELREISIDLGHREMIIPCDILAVSGGFNPNLHLTSHMGAKPVYDDNIAAFVPAPEHVPNLTAIGAASGQFADADIIENAQSRSIEVLKTLGFKASAKPINAAKNDLNISPLWVSKSHGKAFLDLQNDVCVKDIELAHRENFKSPEHMKRYTTQGMATDQGKTSNVNALAVLAGLNDASIGETGTTTFRPPYISAPIAALGAGGVGQGFAPKRLLPSHEFSKSKGAKFVEAGLWDRPSYFPHSGDTAWRQSCDREVGYVRQAAGVCDASSLGKILLQGRDAKAFLDMIYTGRMSTLKAGRIRYGIMLREDGMVMDDGTVACLDENQYLITTTTAFAGEVMNHFDFVSQCLMRDADIHYISLTDHYAQYAVAGPKSREILTQFIDGDISDEALPYMAWKDVRISDVPARIYRISFSGELGYEIAVPRRYGEALMQELARACEEAGGGIYGLEALNVMRIEKGFVTHAEIDGRVTAQDLGLGKMVSPAKDCIGKVMAARPELQSQNRQQLVGLKPIGAVQRLLAGSLMVGVGQEPIRENLQGHLSSVCYSPTLGRMIGLAFVENGKARMGERIRAVDLVRDFDTLCEIVDPVFYDPNGERLHG